MGRPITHKYLCDVLNYDPETGSFSWRIDIPKRIKAGMAAGGVVKDKKGASKRTIGLNGSNYFCHRLAWFYVHGKMPEGNVIPINGDFLDCRIGNLRHETIAETTARAKPRTGSTSGVKGVSWNTARRKWVASIHRNYRQTNLGYFDTVDAAAEAYRKAEQELQEPDAETRYQKRKATALRSRLRRVWSHLVSENGSCGWASFSDFCSDIGDLPPHGHVIAPLDATKPVGPNNYKWAKRAMFDKSTREGRRSYTRFSRALNPSNHKAHGLRKSFGMELYEYEDMHAKQNGRCAICDNPETHMRGGFPIWLAVDHNHTTGAIRALLCGDCNKGIGNFRESPERLRAAAEYLEHHADVAGKTS